MLLCQSTFQADKKHKQHSKRCRNNIPSRQLGLRSLKDRQSKERRRHIKTTSNQETKEQLYMQTRQLRLPTNLNSASTRTQAVSIINRTQGQFHCKITRQSFRTVSTIKIQHPRGKYSRQATSFKNPKSLAQMVAKPASTRQISTQILVSEDSHTEC